MVYVCLVVAAVLVLVALFAYDVLTTFHEKSMRDQSYDLRMKHIQSLSRMQAFQNKPMTKEEMDEKFSEEIYKV